jgi:hypothetical protein
LVYVEDGEGGLKAIQAEMDKWGNWHLDMHDSKPTGDVVFTVALNTETDTYTVTMLGSIDAYTVTSSVAGEDETVNKTGSAAFDSNDASGSSSAMLSLSETDAATGITINLKLTGNDQDSTDNGKDVNWSHDGSIGVGTDTPLDIDNDAPVTTETGYWEGNGNSRHWHETGRVTKDADTAAGETLTVAITPSESNDSISNIHVVGIEADLNNLNCNETAVWTTTGIGSGSGSVESGHDIAISPTNPDTNLTGVTFSAENDGSSYGIDHDGITVNYTYDQTFETTATTTTSYDVTLVFAVNAADGAGDPTVFHVTVDANNDGQLTAVSSDEVIGVTTTTTTYADGGETIVVEEVHSTTVIPADDLQAALDDTAATVGTATFTESDVLAGGAGNETLTGSTGADTFVVGEGHDTILDYNMAAGDKVIIDVKYDNLQVEDDGHGNAKLLILDDDNHEIGSVTFVDITYSEGMDITTLVNIEDQTTTP